MNKHVVFISNEWNHKGTNKHGIVELVLNYYLLLKKQTQANKNQPNENIKTN